MQAFSRHGFGLFHAHPSQNRWRHVTEYPVGQSYRLISFGAYLVEGDRLRGVGGVGAAVWIFHAVGIAVVCQNEEAVAVR